MANKHEIIKAARGCDFVDSFTLHNGGIESFIELNQNQEAAFWLTHKNSELSEPLPKEKIKSIFNKALNWVFNEKSK
jgi:hypothetical protein